MDKNLQQNSFPSACLHKCAREEQSQEEMDGGKKRLTLPLPKEYSMTFALSAVRILKEPRGIKAFRILKTFFVMEYRPYCLQI